MSAVDWDDEIRALPKDVIASVNAWIAMKHEEGREAHRKANEARALLTVASKGALPWEKTKREEVLRTREKLGDLNQLPRRYFLTPWQLAAAEAQERLQADQAGPQPSGGSSGAPDDEDYA